MGDKTVMMGHQRYTTIPQIVVDIEIKYMMEQA